MEGRGNYLNHGRGAWRAQGVGGREHGGSEDPTEETKEVRKNTAADVAGKELGQRALSPIVTILCTAVLKPQAQGHQRQGRSNHEVC